MIGIISGADFSFIEGAETTEFKTPYGSVCVFVLEGAIFVPRHGIKRNVPPHRINHRANIFAFKHRKIDEIIGVNSVGSLKIAIPPESLLVPHDYIALWNIPTYYDSERVHITPGLDEDLRKRIISAARSLSYPVFEKGIYFQTSGPRLETKAEINLLKDYADVVGMTMASEATLARELGLRYASICTVDNYCHGISSIPLSFEEILENTKKNIKKVERVLIEIMR
ncbi:MAG: MTAP family purine nucleoside phosphorylase [Candidatus Syntropharchaeia archaeon]